MWSIRKSVIVQIGLLGVKPADTEDTLAISLPGSPVMKNVPSLNVFVIAVLGIDYNV